MLVGLLIVLKVVAVTTGLAEAAVLRGFAGTGRHWEPCCRQCLEAGLPETRITARAVRCRDSDGREPDDLVSNTVTRT